MSCYSIHWCAESFVAESRRIVTNYGIIICVHMDKQGTKKIYNSGVSALYFGAFAWILGAIVAFVILTLFIGLFIKIALVAALFALAYYWFTRAVATRKNRPWQ